MTDQLNQAPGVASDLATDLGSVPMYFPVSVLKLAVMATCTFGLYELYWFYKNWCIVRDREHSHIMPLGRTVFAPLFCYSLFKRMETTAELQHTKKSIEAGALAAGWIIFSFLGRLPDPYWLVSFLAVGYLLPVQAALNEVNLAVCPKHDPNRTFTVWNIVTVAIGSLLFALVLVETFAPSYFLSSK